MRPKRRPGGGAVKRAVVFLVLFQLGIALLIFNQHQHHTGKREDFHRTSARDFAEKTLRKEYVFEPFELRPSKSRPTPSPMEYSRESVKAEPSAGHNKVMFFSNISQAPKQQDLRVPELSSETNRAHCPVLHPRIIIYNRIPKCASGSMNIFIEEAQMRKNFTVCRSSIYTTRHLNHQGQKKYAEDPFQMSHCRNRPKRNQLGILSRHIFFQDFRPFNKPQPAFMNIMSEHKVNPDHVQANPVISVGNPIDRCVSRFYYERDARGTVAHAMTIDECMSRNGPCKFQDWKQSMSVATGSGSRIAQMREECSSNYLSRWFCGMEEVCSHGNLAVLEKAKENLQNLYAFVGLTEEMKTSFAVLKRILPDFFAAGDIPMDICNKCKSNDTGKSSPSDKLPPRPPPGEKNLQTLRQLNSFDIELYDFAVKLFWEKAAACGVSLSAPPEGGN